MAVNWRKASCDWSTIQKEAGDHFLQDVHDCGLSLVQVVTGMCKAIGQSRQPVGQI